MKIKVNSAGEIIAWRGEGTSCTTSSGEINAVDWIEAKPPEDFRDYWMYYRYQNGEFDMDTEAMAKGQHEMLLNELRARRENECFPVINRGQLWYSLLSGEELNELNEWYRAWLNVTDTLIVPEAPEWLQF